VVFFFVDCLIYWNISQRKFLFVFTPSHDGFPYKLLKEYNPCYIVCLVWIVLLHIMRDDQFCNPSYSKKYPTISEGSRTLVLE
jgi:hypothetical protein